LAPSFLGFALGNPPTGWRNPVMEIPDQWIGFHGKIYRKAPDYSREIRNGFPVKMFPDITIH
jgi:hypothetical protein